MDAVVVVTGFAGVVATIVKTYAKGRRLPDATKKNLENVIDLCRSIAHDKDGKAKIETVKYEQGVWTRRLEVSFDTSEAKSVIAAAEAHKADMDEGRTEGADHERVLMVFERSSIRDAALGRRSGERVVIEAVDRKARPLIYASNLAEQHIKHEIREAGDNVFKKGFIVDVNVETRNDRPVAYRVTHVHQIFDLPEDGEEIT